MAKKQHPKGKHRNARPRARHHHRNAAPREHDEEYKPGQRLIHAAMGATATTVAGTFLANQGLAPEAISGALAAIGATLAWQGKDDVVRNVGSSVMSSAGAQFGLLMLDRRRRVQPEKVAKRNAGPFEDGALQAALERARMRAALESDLYQDAA